MLWRVRSGAILGDFPIRKFSRRQNFAIEIARHRAEIRCARRAAAWQRPSGVPKHCAERRHAAAREIRCDSRRISDRNLRKKFRDRKILRSKSREVAPKSAVPHLRTVNHTSPVCELPTIPRGARDSVRFSANFDRRPNFSKIFRGQHRFRLENAPKRAAPRVLQPGHDPQRSPNSVPSVGMLWRVRFGAILGEFLTEIFEKISRPRNFAIEIARDRAEIRCPPRAAAWPRA